MVLGEVADMAGTVLGVLSSGAINISPSVSPRQWAQRGLLEIKVFAPHPNNDVLRRSRGGLHEPWWALAMGRTVHENALASMP